MAELDTQPPDVPPPPATADLSPGATTSLATPPAAPDPAEAARAAEQKRRAEIFEIQRKQLEAAGQRTQEAYEAKEKALAPFRAEELAASQRLTATSEEQTKRLDEMMQPLPPYQAPDLRQSLGEWMMVAAGFGAIAGAFGRAHTTAALDGMAGMLNGVNKGSKEAIETNYQTWEANAKRAETYNRQLLTRYKAIMDDAKLNWDVKSAQIKMVADQFQDEIMSSAAEQKNITQMMELYDKKDRFDERMSLARERFTFQKQYQQNYTQRLKDRQELTAIGSALRTDENAEAAIRRFEPVAALNGRILRDLAAKVNPSNYASMNAFTQALRKAGGDKDVAQFNLALESYRTEVGRILNTNLGGGGALSVNAKRDADSMVAGTAPPDVILRVTKTFDQEMKYKQELIAADKRYQQGRIDAYGTTTTPEPYEPPTAPPTIPPGTEGDTTATPLEDYRID